MITGSFTAVGDKSGHVSMNMKEIVSAVLAGSFTGSVVLERSTSPDSGCFQTVATLTDTTAMTFINEKVPVWYRLRCTAIGAEETITYSFGNAVEGITVIRRGDDGFISESFGKTTPADGLAGFSKGSIFLDQNGPGAGIFVNAGTSAACIFRPFGTWEDSADGNSYSLGSTNAAAELVEV